MMKKLIPKLWQISSDRFHRKIPGVILLVLICLLVGFKGVCQSSIEITQVTFDGEKVMVDFVINDPDPSQKFKVTLYSNQDNYSSPLTFLMGDFGENISPGKRKIIWDAKSTLPADFDQDVRVRLQASRVLAPSLSTRPLDQNSYKKGRVVELKWLGGKPTDKINIDLFKGSDLVANIVKGVDNTQSYHWIAKRKAGKKYFLRVSNANRASDVSSSQFFAIKPKTPFIVKVLPFLAGGAAVYFLLGSKSSSTPDLPGPINPN